MSDYTEGFHKGYMKCFEIGHETALKETKETTPVFHVRETNQPMLTFIDVLSICILVGGCLFIASYFSNEKKV